MLIQSTLLLCILPVLLVLLGWMPMLGVVCAAALCSTLATMGHHICIELVHVDDLTAFVACCFIPLNKQPGVRPIGIGEVPRRIISKAALHLVNMDIREACGPLQVYAGCEGGCKAPVYAMRQLFKDSMSHAALLVDAFNSVNRQAALHNILRLCLPLVKILINTYQHPVCLIIFGSGDLVSTEGTTSGQPSGYGHVRLGCYSFDPSTVR